jgi:hypothetical protein
MSKNKTAAEVTQCDNYDALNIAIERKDTHIKLQLAEKKAPTEEQMERLSAAISDSKSLKYLDVSNNGIDENTAIKLAGAITTNTSIEELDISHNNIKNNGAGAFAKAFKNPYRFVNNDPTNHTLKHLNLSYNKIRADGGLTFIVSALKGNTNLESLDVSGNGEFAGIHMLQFAALLHENSHLKQLGLKDNSIRDHVAKEILNSLKTNNSLVEINLDGNREIQADTLQQIAERIEINRDLRSTEKTNQRIHSVAELVMQAAENSGFPCGLETAYKVARLTEERAEKTTLYQRELNLENTSKDQEKAKKDIDIYKHKDLGCLEKLQRSSNLTSKKIAEAGCIDWKQQIANQEKKEQGIN